jgi:hypothetical protein
MKRLGITVECCEVDVVCGSRGETEGGGVASLVCFIDWCFSRLGASFSPPNVN